MVRIRSIAALLLAALYVSGCTASHPTTNYGEPPFVATPPAFRAQCRSTARAVGYPVPCPLAVPLGFAANQDGATPGCEITIICPVTETGPWHGWVFGDSASERTHLVITVSPRPLRNYAKFVDGPGWYPAARIRPLGWVTIDSRRMRAVFVPPTNESVFMHHVVLIWTVGQHTYGVGFHDPEQFRCPNCTETAHGLRRTLLLDEELARHLRLVGPS